MTRNVSGAASDDHSEMTADGDFSDRDLDALVSGRDVRDPRLTELVSVMTALRASAAAEPSDEQATSMALALARAVPATTVTKGVGATTQRRSSHRGALSRRLIAVVTGAGLLGVGFAGAAAADGAAPGDFLYGLDRALESVGINDGGAQERLAEVGALLDAGDLDGALVHAEQATDEIDPEATESLRRAAAAIAAADSDQEDAVREQVAAMLAWMMITELEGEEFGQGVADLARTIGEQGATNSGKANPSALEEIRRPAPADGPANVGPPAGAGEPGKPATPRIPDSAAGADRPANSDNTGSPSGTGKPANPAAPGEPAQPAEPSGSGDTGPAEGQGKPDHAGTQGKPDHAGTQGKPDHAGTQGKPDHAGTQGKPDHAGTQGKPDHAGKP